MGAGAGHAREIAAHDAAMSGRNRLLATNIADLAWLAALEDTMARHAVAATAARMSLVARLGRALAGGVVDGFPPVRIALECPIASRLAEGAGDRGGRMAASRTGSPTRTR